LEFVTLSNNVRFEIFAVRVDLQPEDRGRMFLRNGVILPQHNTVSQTKRSRLVFE